MTLGTYRVQFDDLERLRIASSQCHSGPDVDVDVEVEREVEVDHQTKNFVSHDVSSLTPLHMFCFRSCGDLRWIVFFVITPC